MMEAAMCENPRAKRAPCARVAWRRSKALAVLAAAVLLPSHALAQDKGESWEITTKMEMPGMPMAMPARTNRVCVAKDPKDDAFVPKQEDCRVVDSRRSANKFTFTMECAGTEPSTTQGEITFGSGQYDGRMQMTLKRSNDTMNMSFSGKRLGGECVDTSRQQVAAAQAQSADATARVCREGMDKLMWQYFFTDGGGVGTCAAQQKEFCARVAKVGQDMREPEGYRSVKRANGDLSGSFSRCGVDLAGITAAACKRGVEARNWAFVAEDCDDDVRTIGRQNCEGRAYSSVPQGMGPVCSRYASLMRGPGGATPPAASAPAAKSAPTAADAVQEGVNALKKLLPF